MKTQNLFRNFASAGLFLGLVISAPANAASTVVFAGVNGKANSYYVDLGFVNALNGDIGTNGFLLRGVGGIGGYSYKNSTRTVDGTIYEFDATPGYQWLTDAVRLSAYAGVNYQHNSLSPNDPGNPTRGGAVGFKIQGELETLPSTSLYANLIGGYSTANRSYWTRARAGLPLQAVKIGPEVTVSGNRVYTGTRFGAFAAFGLGNFGIDVSGGYARQNGTQSDGVYGALNLSTFL